LGLFQILKRLLQRMRQGSGKPGGPVALRQMIWRDKALARQLKWRDTAFRAIKE
jgi:hypothetical protein